MNRVISFIWIVSIIFGVSTGLSIYAVCESSILSISIGLVLTIALGCLATSPYRKIREIIEN